MNHTIEPFYQLFPNEPVIFDLYALWKCFDSVPDKRYRRGRRYVLSILLIIALFAKLAQHDNVAAIAEWAQLRSKELQAFFGLSKANMPHAATWGRILSQAVDPETLVWAVNHVLGAHHAEEPERGSILITMDGKTMRGTIPMGSTCGVHLLAAFVPAQGVVLFQVEVDGKENEISAAPRLLQTLDLRGAVVTGDAMHTQRDLSVQILDQGGDYLWTVKNNQPTLRTDLETLFDPDAVAFAGGEAALDFRTAETVEKGHGRIEKRTITVSSLLKDYSDWPGLEQAFQLNYERTDLMTGQTTLEIHYGITSQPPEVADPKRLLAQIRGEWTIENQVHWRRDVTMHEDASQVRKGDAPRVLAALNTMVVSLVLSHGYTNLASFRRQANHTIDRGLQRVLLAGIASQEDRMRKAA